MKHTRGLAAVAAVALLACGGAVAAASSSGGGSTTTTTTTTATSTAPTTTTTTTPMHRRLLRRPPVGQFGLGGGFGFNIGGGLALFDAATRTALQDTVTAAQTAAKTATDAGKAPDDARDAAIAAAKARLDQAVTDDALTKGQAASVLAALTKVADARAAAIDAAAGALNLSPTDLAKQLAAGTSLASIAKTQNVDIKTVIAAILKAQGVTAPTGGMGGSGPAFGGRPGLGGGFGGGFGFAGPGKRGFGGHGGFLGPHGRGSWKGNGKGHTPPAPPTATAPTTTS
jgi:hypothetical protein